MKRILLTAAGVTAISAIATQAHANNYQVKFGDTLYSIAKENGTSVAQLKTLNTLKGNKVLPGQKIKIVSNDYYRVQDGDSIQSVAKQFKVTPFEIRFWNKLSSSELRSGKKLIISEKAYRQTKERKRSSRQVAPALSPTTARFVSDINEEERTKERERQRAEAEREFENEANDRSAMRNELRDDVEQVNTYVSDDANREMHYPIDTFDNTLYDETYDSTNNTSNNHNTPAVRFVNASTKKAPSKVSGQVAEIAHRIAAGKSYVYGANSNTAVDCSSFAQQVFAAMGKSIPRTTYAQMAVGTRVSTPQPGDLVFFNNGSHVGVYIGNGQMVDALNPEVGVGQRAVSYVSGTVTGYYRY